MEIRGCLELSMCFLRAVGCWRRRVLIITVAVFLPRAKIPLGFMLEHFFHFVSVLFFEYFCFNFVIELCGQKVLLYFCNWFSFYDMCDH